jgi:hypothetical protein
VQKELGASSGRRASIPEFSQEDQKGRKGREEILLEEDPSLSFLIF